MKNLLEKTFKVLLRPRLESLKSVGANKEEMLSSQCEKKIHVEKMALEITFKSVQTL